MGSRFQQQPADALRRAIREADGNEVFAIGDVDGEWVTSITVTCRGQADRVVALVDRPRAGQVVIHNHPSGDLTPSDADMQLAGRYGDAGVGVVIVDNEVTSANWVVEPYRKVVRLLDPARVREVFERDIPRAIDGFEARPQQIEMALAVTACLNQGPPLTVEAGTGTGKSLAYLVPAALWAMDNESRVVVSTYTRTLQAQLLGSDAKVLARAGIGAVVHALQGRNNYLCKRRLEVATAEGDEREEPVLDALSGWSDLTPFASRMELPFPVDGDLWERVLSDTDLTMRTRCPHYETCHYYSALRQASAAHVVIVNHALLLADLAVKAEGATGILPKYDRLVLDEAHHLEDAATGASSRRLTVDAVRRAVAPLVDGKRRRGALGRISRTHLAKTSKLPPSRQGELEEALITAEARAHAVVRSAEDALGSLSTLLPEDGTPVRITSALTATPDWTDWLVPTVRALAAEIEGVVEDLEGVISALDGVRLLDAELEPMFDVRRARRRLTSHVDIARGWLAPPQAHTRWFEAASRRADDSAALSLAPIEVGPTLTEILWSRLSSVVCTSATLTVAGSFRHWLARTGLSDATSMVLPSPFDHFEQAILGLPRDLPEPNTDGWTDATARAIVEAVSITDGGAFVLCTSYAAVQAYAQALRSAGRRAVLAQGEGERTRLLERFLENRNAVLVGTDSFWEGVSVKGDGLRLVIIPRMPFRVPSDPLHEARREEMEARGVDPFTSYSLPEAILKLRQGYGRLIRAHTDRGVVLLLDTRVHSRRYGRIVLQSLPPARRVKGPRAWVEQEIRAFFER